MKNNKKILKNSGKMKNNKKIKIFQILNLINEKNPENQFLN